MKWLAVFPPGAQSQIFMSLGPQMADIIVNNQMANFNAGPYGDPLPLKNKNFEKSGFVMF